MVTAEPQPVKRLPDGLLRLLRDVVAQSTGCAHSQHGAPRDVALDLALGQDHRFVAFKSRPAGLGSVLSGQDEETGMATTLQQSRYTHTNADEAHII